MSELQKIAILLSLLFIFNSCNSNKNVDQLNGISQFQDLFNTSIRPGVACFRIPALVTAPNGDLVAAIDERRESCRDLNPNRDINIVIRRSVDNGTGWSDIETVVDFPFGQSASDPSMIVDMQTNTIFLFYNFMDMENEPGIYYLHVTKSIDNGNTWSEPQDITAQIAKPDWHTNFKFITSGNGIQTKSGMLLHTMVNLQNGLHLFGSKDHGNSWFLIDKTINPADESKVVELADGRWMINSRVQGAGLRYVHISSDQGQTWDSHPDSALVDPACNASIIRYTAVKDGYNKDRLLFSNANSADDRTNMTVRISYDEGKTWSKGKTIYMGESAYSSLTVLQNGDIGLFFEKDDYSQNAFVKFSLEWLTDDGDKLESRN